MRTSRTRPVGAAVALGGGGEDAYGRRSLSRSTTDRDAARRAEPHLLDDLAADPATRLVLVDARGRVALDVPAVHPDLPEDGLTPPAPTDRDVWQPAALTPRRPRLALLTAAARGGGAGSGRSSRSSSSSSSPSRPWARSSTPAPGSRP